MTPAERDARIRELKLEVKRWSWTLERAKEVTRNEQGVYSGRYDNKDRRFRQHQERRSRYYVQHREYNAVLAELRGLQAEARQHQQERNAHVAEPLRALVNGWGR